MTAAPAQTRGVFDEAQRICGCFWRREAPSEVTSAPAAFTYCQTKATISIGRRATSLALNQGQRLNWLTNRGVEYYYPHKQTNEYADTALQEMVDDHTQMAGTISATASRCPCR